MSLFNQKSKVYIKEIYNVDENYILGLIYANKNTVADTGIAMKHCGVRSRSAYSKMRLLKTLEYK